MTRTLQQQQARRAHLCALLRVQFPPDVDDGMTAQDWQQAQEAAAEREQAADDARMYGTGRDGSRDVGY